MNMLNRSVAKEILWFRAYYKIFSYMLFMFVYMYMQGRSEGTPSVAFEILIINCQTCFIKLIIFNCLILNVKLFIIKLFNVKCLFSENHVFLKQKKTACLRSYS